MTTTIQYVNLYVSNLAESVNFFKDKVGLKLEFKDEEFGYASFACGPIRMGVVAIPPSEQVKEEGMLMVGRQTGIGFCTDDLEITYKELIKNEVEFTMTPTHQPWGGFMAMFKDPDGNTFYLDQPNVVHSGD